jgi:enoyl-CoA hydratase/carnithine racemase
MQIALGCDFRFSTATCEYSIMEAKWGLIPDMSGSITLRELCRNDAIKELAMTGRIIDAKEAERVGLISRIVEDPFEEALKVAKEIVERSPDSVALTKKLFQDTWTTTEKESLLMETELQKLLLPSKNQAIAVGKNFGVDVGYFKRSV